MRRNSVMSNVCLSGQFAGGKLDSMLCRAVLSKAAIGNPGDVAPTILGDDSLIIKWAEE